MLLIKLMTSPFLRTSLHANKVCYEPVCSVFANHSPNKSNIEMVKRGGTFKVQMNNLLHTTQINRDMEAAFKAIGGGIAATGVIGPGIGLGIIFGSLLNAIARNPSFSNKIFQYGLMGAALCESIALFALLVSFVSII